MYRLDQRSEPYQPSDDERTLALAAHISIFLSCFGVFVAGVTWLYAQDKMPYAAFQAFQAILYQVAMYILGLLLLTTLLAVFLMIAMLSIFVAAPLDGVSLTLLGSMINIITGVPLVVFILLVHVYAGYAGYQSYKGRPFRIPGIGTLASAFHPMPPVHHQGSTQ